MRLLYTALQYTQKKKKDAQVKKNIMHILCVRILA